MDVTKLFDRRPVAPLAHDRLETMIDRALAEPQLRDAANQNFRFLGRFAAAAAALVIAITVTFTFMPQMKTLPSAAVSTGDAYSEISDLLILETLNDLS